MVSTRRHRYSEGQGFGNPYDGFDLDPPTYRVNGRLVDPADDHALAELVDEAGIDPEAVDPAALVEVGLAYVAVEEYEQAVDSFGRAITYADEDSPTACEAWVNRGVAHAQLGEYDEAVGAYREALRIDGDGEYAAVAETNLAYALWELGDSSAPLDRADRAVELDPRLPQAWYNRGFFLAERGLHEEAVRCFDAAIALGMRDASVRGERERSAAFLEADAVESETEARESAAPERARVGDEPETREVTADATGPEVRERGE
ncbi:MULTISPECIES: tetratricopeptide repeat protein [Haloferax]|nr:MULTISPECIES: tetratricopeptide repeat protein [Haloferax]MDS0242851.1 tetratricopeptide repeat protein [Haloferax sp. S2CR25]MDS0445972.1 tetratricopeptide repeat protein [Haloferax sp. S2CR25-2]